MSVSPVLAVVAERRAGLYVRISKYDGDGRSPGTRRQEADCRAEAERRGWEISQVYVDDDRSAFSGKPRPAYQRLCADVAAGAVDAVIVWDTDRLHRHPRELEGFVDLVESSGCAVASVCGGDYDLGTADGRFRARIMGAVARKESEDKSRRLRRMHADKIARGEPNGGERPYGFESDRVTPRPAEAAIVAEVVERVARGETLTAVAADLNARGVPAARGGRWNLNHVRRLCSNWRYIGRRSHHGDDAGPAAWPALADEATWRRARATVTTRTWRRAGRRYLLSGGTAICGRCGGPLVAKPHYDPKGVPHSSYECRPRSKGGCSGVRIRAEAFEQLVVAAAIDYVESTRFARRLRAGKGADREAAAQIERITVELDELADAMGAGSLTVREYQRIRAGAVARLDAAQARMAADTTDHAVGRFAGRAGTLAEAWESMTLDERRSILRAVIEAATVEAVGHERRKPIAERVQITWRT